MKSKLIRQDLSIVHPIATVLQIHKVACGTTTPKRAEGSGCLLRMTLSSSMKGAGVPTFSQFLAAYRCILEVDGAFHESFLKWLEESLI